MMLESWRKRLAMLPKTGCQRPAGPGRGLDLAARCRRLLAPRDGRQKGCQAKPAVGACTRVLSVPRCCARLRPICLRQSLAQFGDVL